jgi:hypothetical protein
MRIQMLKILKIFGLTALTLTLGNLSQSTVQAILKPTPVRIALPSLAIIHRKDGSTQSGTIMSITNQSITLERGGQSTTIKMTDINPKQGIIFDQKSPTYRCSKCDPVLRSPQSMIGKSQGLQSISLKDFRFTDAQKGQAEILPTSPQLQSAAQSCRTATCIVDSIKFDATMERNMTLRYTPYQLN